MKAIFLGRKPAASAALRHLVAAGFEVVAVVAPPDTPEEADATFWRPLLADTARELGLPVCDDGEVYSALSAPELDPRRRLIADVDVVFSFLYWRRIRQPLIALPRVGCFNFHPAPLPECRGRRGYNFAILERDALYGASVHWVSDAIDEGDLVEVRRFPITDGETAYSLEQRTMDVLLELFRDFTADLLRGAPIPRTPQDAGRSATKSELLAAMRVDPSAPVEFTERQVRAFWYPPHHGAYVEIGGRRFTLVDDETLNLLGRYLHGSRPKPY